MMTIAFPTLGVEEVITSHAATAKTAPTVGARRGAVPVHRVEVTNRDQVYEGVVKMDDGSHRTASDPSAPPVREGDDVKLRDGQRALVEP